MDGDEVTTTDKSCFKGIHSYIYSVQNFRCSHAELVFFITIHNNSSKKLHMKGAWFFNYGYMMQLCIDHSRINQKESIIRTKNIISQKRKRIQPLSMM
jgi:hypothetical protein